MKNSRGFTLIELLVVIAIIGILSSVVLASLNSARSKGNDVAVRSNLANIRTQAAVFLDNGSSITDATSCTTVGSIFADSVITKQIAAAQSAGAGAAICNSKAANSGSWAVQVQLKGTNPALYACADGSGITSTSTSALSPATSPAVCP